MYAHIRVDVAINNKLTRANDAPEFYSPTENFCRSGSAAGEGARRGAFIYIYNIILYRVSYMILFYSCG